VALLTSDMILDQFLNRLEAETAIMKMADGRFDKAWGAGPAKGRAVALRLPIYVAGRRGEEANPQAADERSVLLQIPDAFGADTLITDSDLAMSLTDFDKQFIGPSVERVASDIANDACRAMFFGTHNFVGVPGTVPTSLDTYQDAHRLLTQGGAPVGQKARAMLVDAAMDQKAVAAGRTLFNSPTKITDQYESGTMGLFGGAMWSMEQHLYQFTVGVVASSLPRVNGTQVPGASVITDGWNSAATTINAGDKIQFENVFMVHPVNGRIYADRMTFTQLVDVSDSTGAITLTLDPPLELAGPYRNVSQLPANDGKVYVWGKTDSDLDGISGKNGTAGILMHKSALVYASPELELPQDVDRLSGRTRSERMNLSIRLWRASDIKSGQRITRLDLLCGFLVPQYQRACLIASA
jgi:hypothetical protein